MQINMQSADRHIFQTASYHELDEDTQNQVDCLAANMYFEARGEAQNGQVAIAMVTLNRVQSGMFPESVCGVVKQKARATCQFSWWCNAKLRAKALRQAYADWDTYEEVRDLAIHVYLNYNELHDETDGALFYHAHYVPQRKLGVKNLLQTAQIGQHVFYRTKQ